MSAEDYEYYRTVQEIPTRGEAVSIYECEPEEEKLWVQRFVTHIPETEDYDRLEVDWSMELTNETAEEVDAGAFQELWDLQSD